jgi:hypothetical protein
MIYGMSRVIVCFLLAILTSTIAIRYGLRLLIKADGAEPDRKQLPASGFWFGFFETVLVFVLVIERQYTALALIMAAILYVQKERIAAYPVYHLLGTLINLGIAIIFALLARLLVSQIYWATFV